METSVSFILCADVSHSSVPQIQSLTASLLSALFAVAALVLLAEPGELDLLSSDIGVGLYTSVDGPVGNGSC